MAGADDKGDGPSRTVYQPSGGYPQPGAAGAGSIPPPQTTQRIEPPTRPPTTPPTGSRLAVGEVLNHIYEVRRFIDRGGMGETWEGANVNTDERVCIKVILPHLADDPNVQAMFRREARTLTRLNHPALVQYRVLAQEPRLGVLYIVTEFVDGIGLDLLIGQMIPTEDQVRSLMRRLADGLRAAHELGAVHRDISPDNILAPEGRIEQSKIIDFGIAKDLQTSQATIVGAGFAGKLGFVAPEQFGDYDRQIGPWTDVYSLGLVMLAFATGRVPDMGTSLVEAVDRRRAGPDLSKLPASLKPLFTRMLAADPQQRFRSMDEVLTVLDKRPRSRAKSAPPAPPVPYPALEDKPAKTLSARPQSSPPKARSTPPPVKGQTSLKPAQSARAPEPAIPRQALIWAGGAFLAVLVLAIAALLIFQPKPKTGVAGALAAAGRPAGAGAPSSSLVTRLDGAVNNASCAWLDYDLDNQQQPPSVTLTGAAGDPGVTNMVQQAIGADGRISSRSDVKTFYPHLTTCGFVNALRPVRAPTSGNNIWFTTPQTLLQPAAHRECGDDPAYALAVIEGDQVAPPGQDAAMFVLDQDGQLRSVFNSRAQLQTLASGGMPAFKGRATLEPDGRFSVSLCEHTPGSYAIAMVRGQAGGIFDLVRPIWSSDQTPVDADLAKTVATSARQNGWTAQMRWFVVGSAAPAATASAPQPQAQPERPPAPRPGPAVGQKPHGGRSSTAGGARPQPHHTPTPPPPPKPWN